MSVLIALLIGAGLSLAAERRPMEPLDLLKLDRLSGQAVSPDGEWVVYGASMLNWKAGKRQTDLFVAKLDGSERRRMTYTAEQTEKSFVFSRDSKAIVFLSDRQGDKQQIYWLPLEGGEARKLTDEPKGVVNFQLSRDGKYLAYLTGPAEKRTLKLLDLSVESSAPAALTKHATSIEAWKWHPDSRRILFTAA
ncbi:MAG: hypothetical protein GY953_23160, partial [bacterium]|nr:hypothetical protein [bacterium]